ncbi:TAXI family TRAP transporter solute-binding subunit [Sporosarcina sp. Marseille-Q4063]|uniref:TAXI family TRAP transporter solute-binding subunit n=1 Tax=Sporosarcina sp. Marseille-Q4063 TaxID=2810514 RepID=UPI001BAF9AAF|nr:TAXI family TRAP transporter solute-binding subunit [Sporosarcina sp. Marseille-Q4063]QUW21278.1 TAXI family TRAP transporter solute-binding subunit [Sporosarcina sp. Marseille-Q4063]
MGKKSLAITILLMFVLIVTACSDTKNETRRSIGTGGSGGVFYIMGAGIGNLVTTKSDVLDLTAQSTAATTENLNLVNDGDLDFAFSVYDAAVDAINGEGGYDKLDNLRIVMAGHGGYKHLIVREDSKINSIADLKGKKVGISPGDIGKKLFSATIEPYGLTLDDLETVPLSYTEMSNGLKDKTLDAISVLAGLPASSVIELGSSIDIRFLSQTEEGIKKLTADYPYWFDATIPAESYKQEADIKTFVAPYVIIANKDVPDEVVYDFIKIMFENESDIEAIHPEGKNYSANNEFYTQEPLVPYHEGAEKYLKEQGVIE